MRLTSAQLRGGAVFAAMILCGASSTAEEAVHDFRGAKFDQDLMRFDGADAHKFYAPEPEGLRVRLGDGEFPRGTVGVAWKATVRGDFTATAHYEILENERPKSGYGAGVELYLYLDNIPKKEGQSRDGIAFVRLARPAGGLLFRFSRMTYDENDQRVPTAAAEAPADPNQPRGRLRLTRQGPTLIASFAEGDDGEFQELQRTDIGAVNIRMVRFAGMGNARLDARLLEMRLEGPQLRLQGKPIVAEPPPGSPPPEPTPPGQRIYWMLWTTGAVIVFSLLCFAVVRRKRSKVAATAPLAATLEVRCPNCQKRLKVSAAAAGKKVKCPACDSDCFVTPRALV